MYVDCLFPHQQLWLGNYSASAAAGFALCSAKERQIERESERETERVRLRVQADEDTIRGQDKEVKADVGDRYSRK